MPRPSHPLLQRDRVIAKALEIIDAEGLAACSLPRLAREFEVKAPALYHHFADRAEIMSEVARSVVLEIPAPRPGAPGDWIEWLVALCVDLRRAVLRHPHAAPLLLEFVPRDLLTAHYDEAIEVLAEAGVPAERHALILDGMENLTLGAALTQAMRPEPTRGAIFAHADPVREPRLVAAVLANRWRTPERLFAESVRVFLQGAAAQG
ncbi:TetR family transcriptional regulator [Actinocorallia herbida]|uniref:TetR family transcriptional regulator n=1 Tax=Actinocorallia herbida TaxID=58109 RepID=A0A3N1CX63_9ACTN|nr:TetR/AcrR family transcriptional regulator [Actinocorallia herbida]ROO85890.1 TetR family transcriptional regulator [Actinocorallia herbida]